MVTSRFGLGRLRDYLISGMALPARIGHAPRCAAGGVRKTME
jgi:hypothetical protein